MPKRYILTGAPGAGKTVLLRRLERDGFAVVAEAATDVIELDQAEGVAEPWRHPRFISDIVALQQHRASADASPGRIEFHDRSVFCTYALAVHLGYSIPPALSAAIDAALATSQFMPDVFVVELLDFITPTPARRIGLDEARRFEATHREVYRRFGFTLVPVPPAPIATRAAAVRKFIGA